MQRFGLRVAAPLFAPVSVGPRTNSDARAAEAWWSSDTRWYRDGAPPRKGNRVAALVDGRAAMLEMYLAIYHARDYILLAEWSLTPEMELVRGRDQINAPGVPAPDGRPSYTLRDLLAYKAASIDVRVLLWQGLLLFRPRRHLVYQAQSTLNAAHPNLHAVVDATEPFGNSHHQKFLVVDGQAAFVGGLDFTNFDADRWDTSDHQIRDGRNWHDMMCRVEGPCVEDVQRNFSDRWRRATRDPLPALQPPRTEVGSTLAQVLRTVPARTYPFARRGEEGIAHGYREAIARAERFIYIENQYLWSPLITAWLIEAIEKPRAQPFHIAIVLPVRPNIGKTDTDRNVRRLFAANRGRGRVGVYGLYTWGVADSTGATVYKPIYVHAKLMIVDDTWLTVGSANLNTRSLTSDSELNMAIHDDAVARHLRLRLWSEHLRRPVDDLATEDPVAMLQHTWPRAARANGHCLRRRRDPLPGRVVPYPLGVVFSGVVKGVAKSS